jgi:DUF4097 and DUF4098 domain-containing protein YvlB
MRRFIVFILSLTAIVVLGVALPRTHINAHAAVAQARATGNWQNGNCEDRGGHWGEAHACQMRHTTFTLPSSHLSVETTNGGIDVIGEDRSDVALEARVQTWASSEAEANRLLSDVVINTTNGDVRDQGPHSHFFGREGYSVDYHLHVPRHLAAEIQTMNGGIDLTRLEGTIRFGTTNGGVNLDQLAGDVRGETVNGGIDITLAGDRWQGTGLHAETTNGGVDLRIPDHYSAHLETGTVNGGISLGFPVTVQGEIKNHLNTDLGSGGPTIHVETVNGGVSINRNGAPAEAED